MDASKVLDEIINLQRRYQKIIRASITEDRYNKFKGDTLDVSDESIREPLIEHVGHLPIIACHLHQYLTNSKKVNLERTLTILAVHDIAETQMGDIFSFIKTDSDDIKEYKIVKQLLNKNLFKYFQEFTEMKTLEAKFAASVDKIAPKLHDVAHPLTVSKIFKHYKFDTSTIKNKQHQFFEWDNNLELFFNEVVNRLEML